MKQGTIDTILKGYICTNDFEIVKVTCPLKSS